MLSIVGEGELDHVCRAEVRCSSRRESCPGKHRAAQSAPEGGGGGHLRRYLRDDTLS